jgi:hypothetical protein
MFNPLRNIKLNTKLLITVVLIIAIAFRLYDTNLLKNNKLINSKMGNVLMLFGIVYVASKYDHCFAILLGILFLMMKRSGNVSEGFATKTATPANKATQQVVKNEPTIKEATKTADPNTADGNPNAVDAQVADENNIIINDDGKDDENSVDGDLDNDRSIEHMKAPVEIYKKVKENNKKTIGPSADGGSSGFTGFSKSNAHKTEPKKVEGFGQNMNRIDNNIHKLNNILKSYNF